MLLNVVAMLELDWHAPGARVIFRHRRRDPGRLAGAGAGRGGVRAAGVRRAGQRQRLRRSVGRGGHGAQRGHRRDGGVRGAELVVLVRLGAPVDSDAGARADRARWPRRCATAAWRRSSRYEPGGDRRLVSRDGRSTYLLATFKQDPAGARPIIEERSRGVPVGDARRRRGRGAAGRRPGLGGHRARRADRVPDPVPAVAARVPLARSRRCCRWPWAARRSCSRSSRSG